MATGPSPRAMKSRSRPATICVNEPSAKYSMKTGPPSTDEIDLPFAGFVHVTVNARSTCHRSRTTARVVEVLPDGEDALGVDLDREAAEPIVRVRSMGLCVTTSGGAARAAGASTARPGAAARSRKSAPFGECHTSNPCDDMTEPKLGAGPAGAERLVRRPVGAEPAAVPADAAPRPVDEDAPAWPGLAAAEARPAPGRDLVEQTPGGECVGELPNRHPRAVVAELRVTVPASEPRLRARSGEDRVQLGDRRLLVRGVPGTREPPAKAAQRLDVLLVRDPSRVGEPVPRAKRCRNPTSRRHSGSGSSSSHVLSRRTAKAVPSLGSKASSITCPV